MSLPPLPIPKPYAERAAEDAQLLASKPLIPTDDGLSPAISLGSQLQDLIVKLGERMIECGTHGSYHSVGRSFGKAHLAVWSPCPSCTKATKRAEAEAVAAMRAEERGARLQQALHSTLLPERFIGQTFETYRCSSDEQAAALRKVQDLAIRFEEHRKIGTTLILSGNVGTGKSHLAGAAIQAIMPARVGMYLTTMGLIRMIRSTWRKDSERTELEVLDDLVRVDLLVLDEVGVQYGTDAEKTLMLEVIDGRYMGKKPSILLTNLDRTAFKEFVGDRLMDRLREVGRWVDFSWPSHRGQARKENNE